MNDEKIFKLIKKESIRQNATLNLIASENYVSEDVLRALGSSLVNKYAEGYPGKRYYGGNSVIDEAESLCASRALRLFHLSPKAWSANVQPYSGSPANLAMLLALVPPGGKIMGLELSMGGHLTHGHGVSATGKLWKATRYGLNPKTETLDYKEIERLAKKEKPALIIAGYTAYSRKIDFKKFRAIADKVGAYLLVDMSHIAGLVAGGAHQSPFPYADAVTTTTHKTLRGPRAAIIFANRKSSVAKRKKIDIPSAIDRAVFPGLQGGPHENQIASVAVALNEATSPNFKNYAKQIVKNAGILSRSLADLGWRIVSGGTDNHLFLVDVASSGIFGAEASDRLERQGIIVNKNSIPFDSHPPRDPSGIRLGLAALTTRGFKEKQTKILAGLINKGLLGENVKKGVAALAKKFPIKNKWS